MADTLRNRAVFAVGALLVLALAMITPTHAAPKADQLGPEVALAAPNRLLKMQLKWLMGVTA